MVSLGQWPEALYFGPSVCRRLPTTKGFEVGERLTTFSRIGKGGLLWPDQSIY